jgi:aconitate hydratase
MEVYEVALTLTEKIIKNHLAAGTPVPGQEIALYIDQTLTQDATGTLAYLQWETLGLDRVKPGVAVSYVDHNTLQTGFENADDHLYLRTVAARYGITFSPAGRGICHQLHLERYGVPGQTLLGSDSHTPTAGGLGMLAFGAGGLNVAVALAGEPYYLTMPEIVNIQLEGSLPPWVAAKDIILEVLRRLGVKGGVGKILEYSGPGVKSLTVPQRATITNMGAETGCTTSIFPSDEKTREYLKGKQREADWQPLSADPGASYGQTYRLDLSRLEPLVAQPHSPDNVAPVAQLPPIPVQQVIIGSCTNSSYEDLARVAAILEGKSPAPGVELVVIPGSRQVYRLLAADGSLEKLIAAGARILESACGPCIGMGLAPASNSVSLRTFNRNFRGRCGTASAQVYLSSPETAAASALTGYITDPRTLGETITITEPDHCGSEEEREGAPAPEPNQPIIRGPNIKPCPLAQPPAEEIAGSVLLKVGDNITTDDIMPAGAKLLPLRSNVPALAQYCYANIDPDFAARAQAAKGGFIVAGENYGQGSSREHAALAPLYLGIRGIIAKSFARIHRTNLINAGILPLLLAREDDYKNLTPGDRLLLPALRTRIAAGEETLICKNLTTGQEISLTLALSPREREVLLAGGLLNYTKDKLTAGRDVDNRCTR